MQITYCCPNWGSDSLTMGAFFHKLKEAGYHGVEIHLPADQTRVAEFMKELEKEKALNPRFVFIAQLINSERKLSVDEYIRQMSRTLEQLIVLQPDRINSQTGRDYFSFEDNCRIIDALTAIAAKKSISLLHETHRGSFAFHAPSLIKYLERYPSLSLTGDFSHFCAVSESMLQDQQSFLATIIPHIKHIHARVGHEQGPQVNDPFAPEWQQHLGTHLGWWTEILQTAQSNAVDHFTITPEFGPWPYMPSLPYSKRPVSDQWEINARMMEYLKENLRY